MKTNKFLCYSLALGLGVTMITSCGSDDSGAAPLPPIGGYNSADEVAGADLVAHWPLDGDGIERKSNTAPNATVGASYAEGIKGEGLTLTNGYLGYPEIAALGTTMSSMSISLWAKISNNGGEGADGHPTMLFSLSRPDAWAGNINVMSETGWRASTSDTLVVKGYVQIKKEDGSVNGQDVINSPNPSAEDIALGHVGNPNKNGGKWAHYVIVWDGATGIFKLYANGVKISNPAFESRNRIDGVDQPLPLNFFTPTKPIIGTFATVISGAPDAWQRAMNGQIDEIRVYKKALTQSDIGALHELEKAGR